MGKIKNIAVIGHSGEGKTTLCEAILFNAKATDRLGKVTDGNTVMDFDEFEIAKKISISMSMSSLTWKDTKLNLMDIPGYFDFEGELVSAKEALDSALIVTSASGSLTVGAEKSIDWCIKHKIPSMLFISGTDKENANYFDTIDAISARFPNKLATIQVPIFDGAKMVGYINMFTEKAYMFSDKGPVEAEIPEKYKDNVADIKAKLCESAAENDEELLELFFEKGELNNEEILKGVKLGIATGNCIPVLGGSGLLNKGVYNLMDELVNCMPTYQDARDVYVDNKAGELVKVDKQSSTCLVRVFKSIFDPFVGKLNIFKVYSGTIKTGTTLLNTNKDKTEKINNILLIRGKKQESVDSLEVGDIGAFSKLSYTQTGDTLCDPNAYFKFPDMVFPRPMFQMSITSQKQGDEDKIFSGLNKLSEEDLSFTVSKNKDTNEMILAGIGETQVDILCKKLKSKFGVDAALATPKVPYKETIRKTVNAEGKHKKQSGGHGQYGHVKVRFEPCEEDFVFADEVVGGSVPKNYFPAVEKGLRECLLKGQLGGYPVVNIKAVLFDGSYHDVDSNEESFKLAAHLAFKDGIPKASPVLLEPICSAKISVPDNFIGAIYGDLNKRRGRILGTELVDGIQVVSAEAPLSEMFSYATDLRSMTQGRGSFEMQVERYEEVPMMLVDKIVAKQ